MQRAGWRGMKVKGWRLYDKKRNENMTSSVTVKTLGQVSEPELF